MLMIVRSPLPRLPLEPASAPAPLLPLLRRLEQQPQRFRWIVPSGRRRRAVLHDGLRTAGGGASLLPGLHTFESFVSETLEYSVRQRPCVSGPERLLRVARAWQEVSGRPPGKGLVRQLDRFVRDWQACGLDPPAQPRDLFESFVVHYLRGLESDERFDRMSGLRALTADVSDPHGWVKRLLLRRIDAILFDGFHRLERAELELIATLSKPCEVIVWLVGVPGHRSWRTLQSATELLQRLGAASSIIDHVPSCEAPLAALGRSLFPIEPIRDVKPMVPPQVFKLEVHSPVAEVEAVARQIKADYLASESTDHPLRLADIAVVLPGPAYDPLIREIFPRAGLEFNLAGRALSVATSRPARVLTAALQVISGQWRHDLLLDFLNLPLVKRMLRKSHLLSELFQHRPRARQRLDHHVWSKSWAAHLDKMRQRIARWQSGELDLPERVIVPREEFVEKQRELANGLEQLTTSVQSVLGPVAALERSVSGPLAALVEACTELLDRVEIAGWLSAPGPVGEPAVPWVEYEKDQQAYYKLLSILRMLSTMPQSRLPLNGDKRSDALAALCLALDGETYQIKTADDAGVQLFELREIRGLRFRHVYVLGMVDGQLPPAPEEGAMAGKRLQITGLRNQREQQEIENTYLFQQVFEACGEQLVLSRPTLDGDLATVPSRFLAGVEEYGSLAQLPMAPLVVSLRDAASRVGRALGGAHGRTQTLAALWPAAAHRPAPALERMLMDLTAWQGRQGRPRTVTVDAPLLLQQVFPDRRAFSPSELEIYAACPFRHFGARVLRLQERDADQPRLHYGSLVHRVLHAFYAELRQTFAGSDGEPLPPVEDRLRPRLAQHFEAEWELLGEGLLSPDLKTVFTHINGVLQLFLEAVRLLEAEYGNLLNEFVVSDAGGQPILLGTDKKSRPVFLSGKIDRVDVDRDSATRAVIIDYKTGRTSTASECIAKSGDGRMLQLPLYAWALGTMRRELHELAGTYFYLSERQPDPQKAIRSVTPFEPEAARRKALELVDEIRGGDFSLTVHGPGARHPECTTFCTMRHACRHPDGFADRRY
jgi:RecB family exonuclease